MVDCQLLLNKLFAESEMSVDAFAIGDYELPPTPGPTERPSPASSPDLNSDPFLSFTGSSLLNGFGCFVNGTIPTNASSAAGLVQLTPGALATLPGNDLVSFFMRSLPILYCYYHYRTSVRSFLLCTKTYKTH